MFTGIVEELGTVKKIKKGARKGQKQPANKIGVKKEKNRRKRSQR